MGEVFAHIADAALKSIPEARCQLCERAEVPVYRYRGRIVRPEEAARPSLARTDPEVFELCASCIHGGAAVRLRSWAAEETVPRFSRDVEATWAEYDRLPSVPVFIQVFDWPLCCGTWMEFVGSPEDHRSLLALQRRAEFWDRGPSENQRDFVTGGPPESMREISEFHCGACGASRYTDQFS